MRMLNLKSVSLVAICAVAAVASAHQTDKEWEARYKQITKFVVTKNFKAFADLVSDNYEWTLPDGSKLNRKQALDAFGPLFAMQKITGSEVVKKVTRKGDLVEVAFQSHWEVTEKSGNVSRQNESGVDTWRKIKGKWLAIKTVDKPAKM